MPTVVRTIDVPQSPEQIWAVGADFSRYAEWNDTHKAFPEGPPEMVEGASFRETVTIMGMPGEVRWTITEVSEPRRFALEGAGPMGIKLGAALELTPNGEGTTGSMEATFGGGPLIGALGDSVAKAAEQATDRSLERLGALIA